MDWRIGEIGMEAVAHLVVEAMKVKVLQVSEEVEQIQLEMPPLKVQSISMEA